MHNQEITKDAIMNVVDKRAWAFTIVVADDQHVLLHEDGDRPHALSELQAALKEALEFVEYQMLWDYDEE